jgi:hypothetical protein
MAMMRFDSPAALPVDASTDATYCNKWLHCTIMFSRMQAFFREEGRGKREEDNAREVGRGKSIL